MRKLLILFAVVAGLFTFQAPITEALPVEKARIELVEKTHEEETEKVASAFFVSHPRRFDFPLRLTLQKPQVLHPHLVTLLISSLHYHASL